MVAHPSSNGGKSSTTEQIDNGIAYIRHDFGWWFAMLGWVVFALGHVQVFSILWRDFGWVVLCIYLAFFTQLITTLAFGELSVYSSTVKGLAVDRLVTPITPARPWYTLLYGEV